MPRVKFVPTYRRDSFEMIENIGLTYDLKTDYIFKDGEPSDANAEFDLPVTIDLLADSIKLLGFKVEKIGNANNLLKRINNLGADMVFNISEGLKGRNRESQVPLILEMMGVPFVGSDSLTMGLTLDKIFAKKILIAEHIPTPNFMEAKTSDDLINLDHLKFPLIVKPRYEGSSKGLSDSSRVDDFNSLKRQVELISNKYNQSALIEEFISGFEYTVAIIGNDPPEAFAPIQVKIDGSTELGDKFYTFAHIYSDRLEYIYPASIPAELTQKICDLAVKTYKAVGCLDFGRVDFRTDKNHNPYVLEVNPLPCLSKQDVFMIIAKYHNMSYEQLIGRIIEAAIKRQQKKG